MSRVVFDIETAGADFDSLDPEVREYFLRWAESPEEEENVKSSTGLYPVTAEIAAIGMLNPDSGKGVVYYQPSGDPMLPFEEEGFRYEACSEAEILRRFWDSVRSYKEFVTFNGRAFDCPFILGRSAVHRLRPARELNTNRFSGPHIDLMDRITNYGASRRLSLDMWCRALGIESPKKGVSGKDVKRLFSEGKTLDIARYCAGDVRATAELLKIWERHMKFPPENS